MGLTVVSEGIETEDQVALLADTGCPYGQGHLFSRPVPAAQVESLLASHRSARGVGAGV